MTDKKVYRVYDSEWEEVMGEEQIKEFALDQLGDKFDDLMDDILIDESYWDKEFVKNMRELGCKVYDRKDENLTMKDIDLIFKAFDFKYEELNIH